MKYCVHVYRFCIECSLLYYSESYDDNFTLLNIRYWVWNQTACCVLLVISHEEPSVLKVV